MYLTPIIYPISVIPDRWAAALRAQSITYVLEIVRDPIYYGIFPSPLTMPSPSSRRSAPWPSDG